MSVVVVLSVLVCTALLEESGVTAAARTAPRGGKQSDTTWVWRCEEGTNCLRYAAGTGLGVSFPSQEECRLTCGTWGALWPRPSLPPKLGTQLVGLDVANVSFAATEDGLLLQMEALFLHEINMVACGQPACQPCTPNQACLPLRVELSIEDPGVRSIEWNLDEGYSLEVLTEGGAVRGQVVTRTVFGARHALQTLSQLVVGGQGGHAVMLSDAQVLNDRPKFTHRGVMVDTARHFFSISSLERTIDAMATNKLNVLHLHLTDSHSFPVQSQSVPEMSRWGAYSAAETYSLEALARLAQYSLPRGVRIIPEIDAPAHAGNGWQWGDAAGLGELAVCINKQPWRQSCIQPPCGQLNPGNTNVYSILGKIYRELKIALEPHTSSVFHMGGDEVVVSCWRSSENVTAWLQSKPGHELLTDSDYHWAWQHFQTEALKELDIAYDGQLPSVILWSSQLTDPQEILQNLDPSRYVIQTWVPENETLSQDLINLGYRVIVSNKDAWYLDWGFWGRHLYSTWKRVYEARLPELSLGGEVALWTELVDELSMDSLVWPRAAALAERLWSNPDKQEKANQAEARLMQWRKRIISTRGVNAAAITPQWCELQEAQCH